MRANCSQGMASNDTYYGKIQGHLAAGQDNGQDIIAPSDWRSERLIRQGEVREPDHENIPNAKNLLPELRDVRFEPGRKQSLTGQSGFTGLAWNKEAFPKVLRDVSDLWQPELKGRASVLAEMRDTLPMMLLDAGVDIRGDWGNDEYANAIDMLDEHVSSGQIRQVKGNSYQQDLSTGDAWAAIAYSGDITQLNVEETNEWEFIMPDAGGLIWGDDFMVPVGSPHKANAEKLVDFSADPPSTAEVAGYVDYVGPVVGSRQAMERIDPEPVEDPLVFPTAKYLVKATTERSVSIEAESHFSGTVPASDWRIDR